MSGVRVQQLKYHRSKDNPVDTWNILGWCPTTYYMPNLKTSGNIDLVFSKPVIVDRITLSASRWIINESRYNWEMKFKRREDGSIILNSFYLQHTFIRDKRPVVTIRLHGKNAYIDILKSLFDTEADHTVQVHSILHEICKACGILPIERIGEKEGNSVEKKYYSYKQDIPKDLDDFMDQWEKKWKLHGFEITFPLGPRLPKDYFKVKELKPWSYNDWNTCYGGPSVWTKPSGYVFNALRIYDAGPKEKIDTLTKLEIVFRRGKGHPLPLSKLNGTALNILIHNLKTVLDTIQYVERGKYAPETENSLFEFLYKAVHDGFDYEQRRVYKGLRRMLLHPDVNGDPAKLFKRCRSHSFVQYRELSEQNILDFCNWGNLLYDRLAHETV